MKKIMYSPEYRKIWDDFCLEQPKAWFWHTSYWLEYCLESRFDVETKNLSYLVMDDSLQTVWAIVPLIIEIQGEYREFSFSGGPIPEPIIKAALGRKEKEIEKFIFAEYSLLAIANDVQRIAIRQSNAYQGKMEFSDTILTRRGYTDMSIYTSVLSLQRNEEQLLAEMTKGHRSAISKAIRSSIEIEKYDELTITADKWHSFKESYFTAAGKKTRPEKAFEILFQFIKDGYGYLFESFEQGQSSSFVYVIVYKSYAYYSMSCRNKEIVTVDSQILQWEIIKFLKKKSILYYELGEQYFTPSFFYPVDAKKIAISQYKRGFGGELITQCSGEYYFSQEYFIKIWNQRCKKFRAYIFEECK